MHFNCTKTNLEYHKHNWYLDELTKWMYVLAIEITNLSVNTKHLHTPNNACDGWLQIYNMLACQMIFDFEMGFSIDFCYNLFWFMHRQSVSVCFACCSRSNVLKMMNGSIHITNKPWRRMSVCFWLVSCWYIYMDSHSWNAINSNWWRFAIQNRKTKWTTFNVHSLSCKNKQN